MKRFNLPQGKSANTLDLLQALSLRRMKDLDPSKFLNKTQF
jgi:hypothetical protein